MNHRLRRLLYLIELPLVVCVRDADARLAAARAAVGGRSSGRRAGAIGEGRGAPGNPANPVGIKPFHSSMASEPGLPCFSFRFRTIEPSCIVFPPPSLP